MPSTNEFLKRILPSEGVYCAFVLPKKTNFWTSDIDELSERLLQVDAEGCTVYHACASYRSAGTLRTGRTRDQALYMRSLWLDVDAGPEKPYKSPLDAFEALQRFRALLDLPKPIVVGSGNGLHVYWALDRNLPNAEWLALAQGLKAACARAGFQAGPERTADAASILRPPGTHHRKGEPILVECGELTGPYSTDVFHKLSATKGITNGRKSSFADQILTATRRTYEPSSGESIAVQCAQLRHMRDNRGVLPEPEWKACLNVLAFATNGQELGRKWSMGDPRYNEAETDSKLERGRELSGPTTCRFFMGLNNLCASCPHNGCIVSPIELGRGTPKLAPEIIDAGIKFADTPNPRLLPIGDFDYLNGSLVHKSEDKSEQAHNELVVQYPIYVQSLSHGEMRSDQHSVIFNYKAPHESWREIDMPMRTLFSSTGFAELAGRGVIIHDGSLFQRWVRQSVDRLQATGKSNMQFEQFGWKEDNLSFLVGRKLYRAAQVVDVDGAPEVIKRGKELGPSPKGSLEGWKEAADQLFARGAEAQGVVLLASFAAPLMKFHATDEGGAVVSIVSAKSGTGKTTALTAAASVWGRLVGLQLADTDTKVAKGITLGVIGSLPVIFDELNNRDPEAAREFIQVFTSGRDKQRGSGDGQLLHLANSWQTILITGSNLSLVDTLRSARAGDAMAMRVMEFGLDLPKESPHWKGDALKEQLLANAGHAGDVYMKALVQPETLAWVKRALPTIREQIVLKCKFDAEHRFWARTLASMSVSAMLIRKLGLLSFSPDRIMEWAIERLTERHLRQSDIYEGSHMLARFLNQHNAGTLVMPGPWKPGKGTVPIKEPMRELVIRYEMDGGRIAIDERALRQWMVKEGVSWQDLLEELERKGILLSARRLITLGSGTLYAKGQIPCVEVLGHHEAMLGFTESVTRVVQMRTVGA